MNILPASRIQFAIRATIAAFLLLTGTSWSNPRSADAEPAALTLSETNPAANTIAAPVTSSLVLTYSTALDASSISSRTIVLHGLMSGRIDATYAAAGNAATASPATAFFPGELVWTSATTGTRSLSSDAPSSAKVFQFTTAASAAGGDILSSTAILTVAMSTAWGDFDGDGDLDLAQGRFDSNNFIYINDGAGNFTNTVSFTSGGSVYDMAWGDVDNDSDLDLATAVAFGQSAVWINDGLGNLSPTSIPVGVASPAPGFTDLSWSDFDGDGFLDLAMGAGQTKETKVFHNNGDGTFDAGVTIAEIPNIRDTLWGDLNNDGAPDLVTSSASTNSVAYLNDGAGNFVTSVVYMTSTGTVATPGIAKAAVLGDFNADGALDILVATSISRCRVFFNDGSAVFTEGVDFQCLVPSTGLAAGDLDGDGDLDVAVGGTSTQSWVYRNNGSGVFDTKVKIGTAFYKGSDLAWGDMDGDGDLDLAMANDTIGSVIYRNEMSPGRVSSLSDLTIAPGTLAPAFVTRTFAYTASVPNSTASVLVTPTLSNPSATYTITAAPGICTPANSPANCTLNTGLNMITVTVTSADGSAQSSYVIEITRDTGTATATPTATSTPAASPTATATTSPSGPTATPTRTPTPSPTDSPTPGGPTPTPGVLAIGNVWPKTGVPAGGMPVSLFGAGFTGVFSVTVGGNPVTFTVRDDSRIDIPAMPAGEDLTYVDVVVTGPSGSATAAQAFLYVELSSGEVPASGGVITTASGATVTVPALGSSFVLTYTPISPPIPTLGNVLMHVFRLDALLNWVPISSISQPITIELPVDPSIVPSGQRPWLYVLTAVSGRSSAASSQWQLVPNQIYDPATQRVTVQLSLMKTYALSTLRMREYWFPVIPQQ